jgi:hypothetical protein
VKFKTIVVSVVLICSNLLVTTAQATENPIVESFTFTPTQIDLLGADTNLNIELIVSHPFGIENSTTYSTVKDFRGSTWGVYLTRTDSPIISTQKRVTFKGMLTLPRTLSTGVYSVEATEVKNNSTAGYQYGTGKITAKKIRDIIDAENALLITSGGELNYEYATFQGPSYDSSLSLTYKNNIKYTSAIQPIWKVGEIFNPTDFYESKVSSLPLQISSTNPTICSSDGKILKLMAEGSCSFTVYTAKTNEFALYENKQIVQITAARIKSILFISKIDTQTSKDLPKSVTLPQVYSAAEGFVLPKTITPAVCVTIGYTARLLSGGTCTLTYQTAATSTHLASDVYQQSFEITRDPQSISFTPPATANLASRTVALSATASSGGAVTYATTSTGICSISGSTLNILKVGNCAITATQAGTTTLAPISATATVMIVGSVAPTKKTITCVKGNKTKKVSGTNPKCPKGYKIKR